jgi:hypothetical protein
MYSFKNKSESMFYPFLFAQLHNLSLSYIGDSGAGQLLNPYPANVENRVSS